MRLLLVVLAMVVGCAGKAAQPKVCEREAPAPEKPLRIGSCPVEYDAGVSDAQVTDSATEGG